MRYYAAADIHGYYSIFRQALTDSGFFADPEPHRLILLGDLFDRGGEARLLQDFILELMEQDLVILVRGNHEDLFESLVTEDFGLPYGYHVQNGTYDTALQLTGYDSVMARIRNYDFADAARRTPFYQKILPAMRDYYETGSYIFTHGWIPCVRDRGRYAYLENWRSADSVQWDESRWINGMDAVRTCQAEKTVVCGHWHASYGHANFEHSCSEFGPDADFSPYHGTGIIALDACTAVSGTVNFLVLEDTPCLENPHSDSCSPNPAFSPFL